MSKIQVGIQTKITTKIITKIILSFYNRNALFILVDPFIVSSPPSEVQVPNVGDSVKLNCSARGLPNPKVNWFKNGQRVISKATHDGKDLIKSEIVIDRFKPSDAGNYICLFQNDKNETAEANSTLSKKQFKKTILLAIRVAWYKNSLENPKQRKLKLKRVNSFDNSLDLRWLPRDENACANSLSRFIDRDGRGYQ